jgi:hypothetical protein
VNDPSTELVKAASQGASEGAARAFLETLFGPAVELSAWGGDAVRWLRFKTQVKVLQRAQALLEDAGLSPNVVPAKTLVPLLELASLEDESDESMHARWAALLANAAAGEASNGDVLPSFPQILAELTPAEAAMLDLLGVDHGIVSRGGLDLDRFGEEFGFPTPRMGGPARDPIFDVYIDNLERLQLAAVDRPDERLDKLEREVGTRNRSTWPRPRIRLTALGKAFVAACTPPTTGA